MVNFLRHKFPKIISLQLHIDKTDIIRVQLNNSHRDRRHIDPVLVQSILVHLLRIYFSRFKIRNMWGFLWLSISAPHSRHIGNWSCWFSPSLLLNTGSKPHGKGWSGTEKKFTKIIIWLDHSFLFDCLIPSILEIAKSFYIIYQAIKLM